jgi:hypothetical protein
MAAQPTPANLYSLSGHHLSVTVSPTLTGGRQLTYHDSFRELTFEGDQLTSEETRAGELLSVFLMRSIDAGSTTFSLLLPRVQLAGGGSTHVTTYGITTVHRFSIIPLALLGQRDVYTVTRLHGSASFVET